nr:FG-GAP-like repeat-containing protein [Pedococcus badiiscoriae]
MGAVASHADARSLSSADATESTARLRTAVTRPGRPRAAVVAASAPTAVPQRVGVVGVTWAEGSGPGVSVQYRTEKAGRWTRWAFLEEDQAHGPDAAEARRAAARSGSDPLVVTDASQVQVRVLGDPAAGPRSPQLVVVDPGDSPADPGVGVARPGAASATASRPTIYTRAQWGADERLRDPSTLEYGAVKAAIVHHTVDANGYSAAQVPALIRGIYAFHVKGRGWGDIGYNFLVDRFGRIWEGRYGGVTLPVVGAQTADHNSWTTGVSVIGNYDTAVPPAAVTSALTRLIAWKAQIHEFDPLGRADIGNLSVPAVLGHRDAGQTACPGRYLYAKLPGVRAAAGAVVAGLPSLSLDRDLDNRGEADVLATNDNADLLLYPTTNQRTISAPKWLSTGGWRGIDLVTIAGDFTGDGAVDLIGRQTSTGNLLLYAGTGSTGLRAARVIGTGWGGVDAVIGVSDWTGDGRPDLLARMKADGSLRLYPGNGAGGFLASRTVGVGWSGMRLLAGVGDWNGDGARDLLSVSTAGEARIYRGNGKGGFGASTVLPGDWSQYTSVTGIGDASGDTRVDVFAVDGQGVGWIGSPSPATGLISWTQQSQDLTGVRVYGG